MSTSEGVKNPDSTVDLTMPEVSADNEDEALVIALLEASSEPAGLVSQNGTFLQINSAGAAMAASEGSADVPGRTIFEFIAPEDAAAAARMRAT